MNKREFIRELKQRLKRLPKQEVDEALNYYEEYFEEGGYSEYDDVTQGLGTPSEVASQILSNYAVKDLEKNPESTKTRLSSLWIILLAIAASPLALPIALPLLITLFVGSILIIVFSFVFIVVSSAFVFAGGAIIYSGFTDIFFDFSSGILQLGLGLIFIGGSVLAVSLIIGLISRGIPLIVKLCNELLNKIRSKNI